MPSGISETANGWLKGKAVSLRIVALSRGQKDNVLMQRTEQQVFEELATLCSSPGYAHAIAYFCLRDSIVSYQEEIRPEDLRPLFRHDRLIRTEISTLVGLMIRAPIDYALPEATTLAEYVEKTETLLNEIHRLMAAPFVLKSLNADGKANKPFTMGAAFREPIFYGNESAYIFQYRDLSLKKYAADEQWMLANKGFDPTTAREVAKGIALACNKNFSGLGGALKTMSPQQRSCLPAFMFTAQEVADVSGLSIGRVDGVLAAFCVPVGETNGAFHALNDFNIVNAQPLLRVDENRFLLFQIYGIAEALYDAPFYWMGAEQEIAETAMKHRGQFYRTILP